MALSIRQSGLINPYPDRVAVVDTNYYTDLSRGRMWAKCAFHFIEREGLSVRFPVTIRAEYEELFDRKERDDLGFLIAASKTDELLGKANYGVTSIDSDLEDLVISSFQNTSKAINRATPGYRDISLIEYALQMSRNCEQVFVISKDRDVFQTLRKMHVQNLVVLPPREILEQELSGVYTDDAPPKRIGFIFSPQVLSKILDVKSRERYVIVSRDHSITSDFKADLGLEVIVKNYGQHISLPDNTYLAPIVIFTNKQIMNKSKYYKDCPEYLTYVLNCSGIGSIYVARRSGIVGQFSDTVPVGVIEDVHLSIDGRKQLNGVRAELRRSFPKAL